MHAVELENKRNKILGEANLPATYPDLGSANVSDSTRMRYGKSVRKLVVRTFDVVCKHDADSNAVIILGLVHQRTIR